MTAQLRLTLSDADREAIKAITGRAIIRGLVKEAARDFKLRIEDLTGPSRRADLCRIREVIYYRAHAEGHSLPQIGRVFNRDHTTILSGIRNEKKRRGEA